MKIKKSIIRVTGLALVLLVSFGSCAPAEGKREGNPYPSYREKASI